MSSSGTVGVNINLVSSDERDRSDVEIADDLEEKLSGIVGADITVSEGSMAMSALSGDGFTLDIKGDDVSTLREISDDLIDRIEAIEGADNIESTLEDTQYQTDIVVDRAKAAAYGISSSSIASAVSAANKGISNTTLKTEGTETDINVMYPDDRLEYGAVKKQSKQIKRIFTQINEQKSSFCGKIDISINEQNQKSAQNHPAIAKRLSNGNWLMPH